MLIKKPIKLTPKKISNWTTTIIIATTIIIMICISLFLYKNFYQTITQTKEIIILREKVALDTINMEKFNIIMKKLTEKTKTEESSNIISPFR